MNWYLHVLKNYASFSGRARRKEYWMFTLISTLISIGLLVVDGLVGTGVLFVGVYFLALLLNSWSFCSASPRYGSECLVGFHCIGAVRRHACSPCFYDFGSTPGENRFGPNPKEQDEEV
jgi:uncharacterized membrane protein YhaH (DUF805 family)